jgi:hypothetical protein
VAKFLTQSTRTASLADGGAAGGIDDRFDLQIATADLLDGAGLSYIGPTSTGLELLDHSYRAFGNDGSSFDMPITLPTTGRSQSAAVLQALHDFSDHLPVIADYQVPAALDVSAAAVPYKLSLGQVFELSVTVSNSASVISSIGADELDYSLMAAGDVSGDEDGTDAALNGGNDHLVTFDTSSLGAKTGMITVSSSSQAVENGLWTLPVEFEVVLAGDYNGNGMVDSADYVVWRNTVGSESDFSADGTGPGGIPDRVVDRLDYDFWKQHYNPALGSGSVDVPEPGMQILTLLALCLFSVTIPRSCRIADKRSCQFNFSPIANRY